MKTITSVERRRRAEVAAITRAAAIANTPVTTRPGSETTRLRVGTKVRVDRARASSGTWARYAGREGWVAAVNREVFPSGVTYVEIGVSWTRPGKRKPGTDVWFRADELVRVDG